MRCVPHQSNFILMAVICSIPLNISCMMSTMYWFQLRDKGPKQGKGLIGKVKSQNVYSQQHKNLKIK